MAQAIDAEGAQMNALRRLVGLRGKSVLEIGCGEGRLTLDYAPEALRIAASDPNADAIATARAALPVGLRDRVTFTVAGAAEVDVAPCSVDLVFFSWSL
jgi:ubiquinone/menaquinone biosynthesis C-methylase UbiE